MFGGNQKFISLCFTDAIGLNMVSIVSWTEVCTCFCAKMSNSELIDNASADMPLSKEAVRKICLLLYCSSCSYLSKVVSPFQRT